LISKSVELNHIFMKLSYRPITIEDLNLRQKWLNDPGVYRFLGFQVRQGTNLEFHQKWFKKYFEDEKSGERKIFIVSDGEKPIGQVGLLDINKDDKNACLYIVIGEKEYRGKGLSQEILRFICNYGFNDLGLHKIYLEVHADNIAGVKAYEKFGFVEEGFFKENVFANGKYRDEIRMALINPKDN